jgi:hypothetical protein
MCGADAACITTHNTTQLPHRSAGLGRAGAALPARQKLAARSRSPARSRAHSSTLTCTLILIVPGSHGLAQAGQRRFPLFSSLPSPTHVPAAHHPPAPAHGAHRMPQTAALSPRVSWYVASQPHGSPLAALHPSSSLIRTSSAQAPAHRPLVGSPQLDFRSRSPAALRPPSCVQIIRCKQ